MAGDDLLSLRWDNHRDTFVRVLTALKNKGVFSDVTVMCGTQTFAAHKIVLAAGSPYFQNILTCQPVSHQYMPVVIVLQDIVPSEFALLLEYMYTGSATVRRDSFTELMTAAEKLKVRGLAWSDVGDAVLSNSIAMKSYMNVLDCERARDNLSQTSGEVIASNEEEKEEHEEEEEEEEEGEECATIEGDLVQNLRKEKEDQHNSEDEFFVSVVEKRKTNDILDNDDDDDVVVTDINCEPVVEINDSDNDVIAVNCNSVEETMNNCSNDADNVDNNGDSDYDLITIDHGTLNKRKSTSSNNSGQSSKKKQRLQQAKATHVVMETNSGKAPAVIKMARFVRPSSSCSVKREEEGTAEGKAEVMEVIVKAEQRQAQIEEIISKSRDEGYHGVLFSDNSTAVVPVSWLRQQRPSSRRVRCVWPPEGDVLAMVRRKQKPLQEWKTHYTQVIAMDSDFTTAEEICRKAGKYSYALKTEKNSLKNYEEGCSMRPFVVVHDLLSKDSTTRFNVLDSLEGPKLSCGDNCKNKDEIKHILVVQRKILSMVKHNCAKLNSLQRLVEQNEQSLAALLPRRSGVVDEEIESLVEVSLPLRIMETFLQFDKKIGAESGFRAAVERRLLSLGGATLKDAVKNIINATMVHDLQRRFNWGGKLGWKSADSTPKKALRNTHLCEVIIKVLVHVKRVDDATEHNVRRLLMLYLRNAGDRDGGRRRRALKLESVHDS